MKKILLLATVMMLFAAVGLMADVSFSGDVRTRGAVEGDEARGGETDVRLRINLNADIDEYNSAYARFRHGAIGGTTDGRNTYFDRAHATTDLSGWLAGEMGVELPVGITYNIGLNEFTYADVADNTSYGFEALQNIADFTTVGSKLNISVMDMANVYFANDFEGENWDVDTSTRAMLAGADAGIDVGVGTAMVEVVYSAVGSPTNREVAGDLGIGLAFTSDALVEGLSGTVGASMTFPLDSDNEDTMYYGVGAGLAFTNLVWADVSFQSAVYDDKGASWVGLGLGSDPVDFFSFGSGLVLYVGDEKTVDEDGEEADFELLDSAEVYGQLHVGAMTYTVGYYWLSDEVTVKGAGEDLNTPTTDFRNVYFTANVSF